MRSWSHEDDLRALRSEIEPDEAALARVRARRRQPRRGPRAVLVLAAALATLALVVLRGPDLLDLRLEAPVWEDRALSEDVALRFQGRGQASGTARDPVIRWEQGTIHLAVTPGQGLNVRVQTPEAEVLVVGTQFQVSRDTLGTEVSVEHGRVSVNCSDGTTRFLTAGQQLHCARSAAAALARARELQTAGADPSLWLDLVQRGMQRADADEAVRDELRLVQVQALDLLERDREALAMAEAALSEGAPPRWRALAAVAARLRVAQGDCAGALPHLERLTAEDEDPVALVLLADCAPERARDALERALTQDLTEAQRAAVQARLDNLPD